MPQQNTKVENEVIGELNEEQRPIFVVGASRSGTALVQSILNNSNVHLAGETHYFDDLRVAIGSSSKVLSGADRRRCEDYFLALTHRPYGHGGDPEKGWMDRQQLRDYALELRPDCDAYFEAYCRLVARRAGKRRWGEKTPRHVFRLEELLTRYPNGQAICMVRDARAVVASYRDWRNQGGFDLAADPEHADKLRREEVRARHSYHILIASLLWCSTVAAALDAQRRFGEARVHIQRYEDLVRTPEESVKRLMAWLGLRFSPQLLEVPLHNSSVFRFDAGRGVTQVAVDSWRSRLNQAEVAIIESRCRALLAQMGYERTAGRRPLAPYLAAWMTLPFAAARAMLANRGRIANFPAYLYRRLRPISHLRTRM